jgi:hypothetical protein
MKTRPTNNWTLFASLLAVLVLTFQAVPASAGGDTQQLSKKFKNQTGKIADNFEASVTGGVISSATSNRPGLTASGQGTKNVKFSGNNLSIDEGAVITFTFEFTGTHGQDDMTAYWTKGPDRISGNLLSHGQYLGTDGLHSYLDFHNPSQVDDLYLTGLGYSVQPSFDLFSQDASTLSYTPLNSLTIAPNTTDSIPIGTLPSGSVVVTEGVEQFGTSDATTFYFVNTTLTPEPSSLFLLGSGMLGAGGVLRRRLFTRS